MNIIATRGGKRCAIASEASNKERCKLPERRNLDTLNGLAVVSSDTSRSENPSGFLDANPTQAGGVFDFEVVSPTPRPVSSVRQIVWHPSRLVPQRATGWEDPQKAARDREKSDGQRMNLAGIEIIVAHFGL